MGRLKTHITSNYWMNTQSAKTYWPVLSGVKKTTRKAIIKLSEMLLIKGCFLKQYFFFYLGLQAKVLLTEAFQWFVLLNKYQHQFHGFTLLNVVFQSSYILRGKKVHFYLWGLPKLCMQALFSSKHKHPKLVDQLVSDGHFWRPHITNLPTYQFQIAKGRNQQYGPCLILPHHFSYLHFGAVILIYEWVQVRWLDSAMNDPRWKKYSSEVHSTKCRQITLHLAPDLYHQCEWYRAGGGEQMLAPESQESRVCVGIHFCPVEPPIFFFMSCVHPLIPPLFLLLLSGHLNSIAYSTLIAPAQVLNYFQTARRGTAATQGTIWTYYIKEFMIWNHHSPPWRLYDMTFHCLKLLPSFALFPSEWLSFPPTTDIDLSLSLFAPGLPCLQLLTPDH